MPAVSAIVTHGRTLRYAGGSARGLLHHVLRHCRDALRVDQRTSPTPALAVIVREVISMSVARGGEDPNTEQRWARPGEPSRRTERTER